MSNVKGFALLALLSLSAFATLSAFEPVVFTIDPRSDPLVNFSINSSVTQGANPKIGGSDGNVTGLADGFCPYPQLDILRIGEKVKVDNLTLELANVSAASPVCDNANPANFYVVEVNGTYAQTTGCPITDLAKAECRQTITACPHTITNVAAASDIPAAKIQVVATEYSASEVSANFAEVMGRSAKCANSAAGAGVNSIPPNSNPTAAGSSAAAPLDTVSDETAGAPDSSNPAKGAGGGQASAGNSSSSTIAVPPRAQPPNPAGGEENGGRPAADGANAAAYSQTTSAPISAPNASDSQARTQLSQNAPPAAKTENSLISNLPWWIAPAIVAALGAFFMAVMVFYYRSPSIFAPSPPVQGPIATPIFLSDSRLALMGELSQTERIPTDIAIRLRKSKSTVVEQLDELCSLGLVERLAQPGKKFVFYRLSRNGRQALLQRADELKKPAPSMPF